MILLRLCYGLCSRYDACLDAYPLLTKTATTAAMGLAGDAAAQVHEGKLRARLAGASSAAAGRGLAAPPPAATTVGFHYDTRRGVANVANSVFLTAPIYHYGYEWLEGLIPIAAAPPSSAMGKSAAALAQVLIDCVFFDALFVMLWVLSAYAIYQLFSGAASSTSGTAPAQQLASRRPYSIRANLCPAILACWKMDLLVIPVEYVLFRYFPLRLRVFGMNLIDLAWDAVVSFTIHDEGGAYAAAASSHGSSWDQEDDSQITTASESTPDTHGLWWGCRSWSRLSFGEAAAGGNARNQPSPLDGAEGANKRKRS